jgi:hypothetical protein
MRAFLLLSIPLMVGIPFSFLANNSVIQRLNIRLKGHPVSPKQAFFFTLSFWCFGDLGLSTFLAPQRFFWWFFGAWFLITYVILLVLRFSILKPQSGESRD